jgi:Domain of unknown function (DUF4157)
MFAPPIAKRKPAETQRTPAQAQQPGEAASAQSELLRRVIAGERAIGSQAQRAVEALHAFDSHDAAFAYASVQQTGGAAPHSWNFGDVAVFSPGSSDGFAAGETKAGAELALPMPEISNPDTRPRLSRKCNACEEEEKKIRTKPEELPVSAEKEDEELVDEVPFAVQASLMVGQRDDPYEKEADQVAKHVVDRMSSPGPRLHPQADAGLDVQRECDECRIFPLGSEDPEDKEEEGTEAVAGVPGAEPAPISRKVRERQRPYAARPILGTLEQRLEVSKAAGRPLAGELRRDMEEGFQRDFSDVRIHTGPEPASMSRAIRAKAFTYRNHIYFSDGTYDPGSREGRQLLAHELTHVIQQTGGRAPPAEIQRACRCGAGAAEPGTRPIRPEGEQLPNVRLQPKLKLNPPNDRYEQEADAVAEAVMRVPASTRQLDRADNAALIHTRPLYPTIMRLFQCEPSRIETTIQRAEAEAFVPEYKPSGTKIHADLLERIGKGEAKGGKDSANADLFTEVAIPGAKRDGVELEDSGVADLYKVASGNQTTIAVVMDGGFPAFLKSNRKLRRGGVKFAHTELGAPRGTAKRGPKEPGAECPGGKAVCRVDQAPKEILIGDLKPPALLETLLGYGQLKNYDTGIQETSAALNEFSKRNPDKVEKKPGQTGQASIPMWNPSAAARIASIWIPESMRYGTSTYPEIPLRLYTDHPRSVSGKIKGRLAVYPGESGIWYYEWIPTEIAESIRQDKSPKYQAALERRDALVKSLSSSEGVIATKPALPGARQGAPVPRRAPHTIQRKPAYDADSWDKDFNDWKEHEAKDFLSSDERGTARAAVALVGVKQRTRLPVPVPKELGRMAEGYRKITLWDRWGGLFGRLRRFLGPLFGKIGAFFEKARERFEALRTGGISEESGSGDRIIGAIIGAALRVASSFVRVIIQRVADKLKGALKKGVEELFRAVFGDEFVEKVESGLIAFQKMVADVESALKSEILEWVETAAKSFQKVLSLVAEVREKIAKIKTVVDGFNWGVRVIQCLTPPGIGCLKLLLKAASDWAISKIVGTCWFQRNFVAPALRKFPFLTNLPSQIVGFIIDQIKNLLPFDDKLRTKLFPTEQVSGDVSDKDLGCDPDGPTKEQLTLSSLYDAYGPKRIRELTLILEKAGVPDARTITKEGLEAMRALLRKMAANEITDNQIAALVKRYDPKKGFANKDLDRMVRQVQGQSLPPEPEGEGGAGGEEEPEAAGPGGVRVIPAPKARGEVRGAPTGEVRMEVIGGSLKDAGKTSLKVNVAVVINNKRVAEVTNVPVSALPDLAEDDQGKSCQYVIYKLKQEIVVKDPAPGTKSVGASAGDNIPSACLPIPSPAKERKTK